MPLYIIKREKPTPFLKMNISKQSSVRGEGSCTHDRVNQHSWLSTYTTQKKVSCSICGCIYISHPLPIR